MKRLTIFLAIAMFIPLATFGQIGISKIGDQIKFTGLGLGNGIVTNSKAYSEIYSSSVDQVMVQGSNLYFINSGAKAIVATVPWARVTSKLGNTTPQTYVEELIALGYLDKTGIKYKIDTVLIGTNQPQGTRYFPDTLGVSMDGFKNIALSGYLTEGQAVNDSIYVQVTNDYGVNWTTVYGYNWYANATVNQLKQTGAGTLKIAWNFPDLNFKYIRVVGGFSDSTNIVRIWARKTN